jgi:hypothetical protein
VVQQVHESGLGLGFGRARLRIIRLSMLRGSNELNEYSDARQFIFPEIHHSMSLTSRRK